MGRNDDTRNIRRRARVFGGEKRRKLVAEREGGIRGMVLQTTSNEVYLREDISCGFPGCVSCDERQNGAPTALNERCDFFLVPSSASVIGVLGAQFWEDLARDCILCKSVETRAREKFNSNPRLMRAMRSVYEDSRKDSFLFDDLHSRKIRELSKRSGCGLVEATAAFYAEKVQTATRRPKVIVLTTKPTKSAVKDNAVTEMHVIEYIQKYHPENEALMSKVQAELEEKEEENEKEEDTEGGGTFSEYLSLIHISEPTRPY